MLYLLCFILGGFIGVIIMGVLIAGSKEDDLRENIMNDNQQKDLIKDE